MARDAFIAIAAGVLSALASLAFAAGTPFAVGIVYMAALPLMMAGLALGIRAATFGALAGFMVTGMMGGALSAAIFGFVHALPAWMTTQLALLRQAGTGSGAAASDWYPPGHIAAHVTMLGAGFLVIAAFMTAGDQGLSHLVATHLGEAMGSMAPNMPMEMRLQAVHMLTPLFPGAVVASWVVMVAVNAVFAQGALVRLSRNLRPTPIYVATEIPQWLSWPLVASAAVALAGSGEWEYLGRNLALVLAVPYFFLGLAVFHTLARRVAFTGPLLFGFYLILIVSIWAALIVAGIGVVEQWFGLRDRIYQPSSTDDEDE